MRKLSQESGLTLVDAVIGIFAVGLLIGVSMHVSTAIKDSQIRARDTYEFENIAAKISNLTASETSCRLSFGGPTARGGAVDEAAQTVLLDRPTDIRLYVPGAPGGGPAGRKVFFETSPTNGANRFGGWTVESLSILPSSLTDPTPQPAPAGPAQFPAQLTLVVTREGGAGRRVYSTSNLTLVTDAANRVVSCSGLTYGTATETSAIPFCGPNEALFSNGTRLGCRRVKCPPGSISNGFDGFGHAICCIVGPPVRCGSNWY